MSRKPVDLTGQTFGKLRALRKTDQRKGDGSIVWECKCEACGRTCYVKSSSLKSGDRKSCGCLHNQYFKARKCFQPAEDCVEYDKENHCCKILDVLECERNYYCVFYDGRTNNG